MHGKALEANTTRELRPARGELVGVLARPRAQRALGDDERGRPELAGELVGAAAADGEHPVGVVRAAGREQRQQGVDADGGHRCDPTALAMTFGVTSMTAPLRRVLVRAPATEGDWAGAGWRVPDPPALARQHDAFCALLTELGAEVEVAGALDGQVDAVYMHDPLLMTARGGIPLRMRKPARAREPAHAREELVRLGVPVLGELPEGAYADGGDRFWIDDRLMAIGLGYRTNRAGAAAVAAIPRRRGRGLRHAARPAARRTSCTCSRSSPRSPRSCA